ncbi:MAG: HD-GYP domain-containing protein [Pirellulaceae bacterium]|nr:HD-GYP domain-containing protein [Pirellulaceae bacterium]
MTQLSTLDGAGIAHFTVAPPVESHAASLARLAAALRNAFGVAFTLWDAASGEILHASVQQPGSNDPLRGQLARAAHGGEAQFIADEDCLLLLAIPLAAPGLAPVVATGAFATRPLTDGESPAGAAALLGLDETKAAAWLRRQTCWSADALLRLATAAQAQIAAELRAEQLTGEVEKLSNNLATTYEEICLLHGLTQNLRIQSDEEQFCTMVLNWLLDCLPAQAAVIQLLPVAKDGQITYKARTKSVLMTAGQCPLNNQQFSRLMEHLNLEAGCGPLVANDHVTSRPGWPMPEVRQVVIVPMAEGERVFGWLALVNHSRDGEFGTVEASLLNSIGAMLGIHSANRDLYRQQSEFLASVVRAFSSAIDAKDPYTCGHSDRVARIAVRLAKEMGCDPELLHTLYMAGLLHDVGKIGIDDSVLRKPGKLTDAEFQHIKQHPELGYRILADMSQLAAVLPAVLHHHEQWDGRGYPFRLQAEQIPLIARIVAVADAYDAMTSDRPYRQGMPVEKVDEIFKAGGGKQWDPEVIAAYFSAREDIREIAQNERANLTLDVQQWS